MTRRNQYLAGALVVAPLWFVLSFYLDFALAGAEDNMDMSVPVPFWLRTAFGIASFPMHYIQNWDNPPTPWYDYGGEGYMEVGIFLNGLAWGLALVFFCRFAARYIRAKKRAVSQSA